MGDRKNIVFKWIFLNLTAVKPALGNRRNAPFLPVFLLFSERRRQKYDGRMKKLLPAAGKAGIPGSGRKIAWHE
jgi:hypothetical protein